MPPWVVKAAVQGVLSRLPRAQRWNRVLQTYVTRSLFLSDDAFLSKWRQARKHLEHYRMAHGSRTPRRALELGTGWAPVVPIGLALDGVPDVRTVDMQPLLSKQLTLRVLEQYRRQIAAGAVAPADPRAGQRIGELLAAAPSSDAHGLLARIGVDVSVGDARASALPNGSVDLFVSNNTLEHIAPDVIREILSEFRRLAAGDAVGSHFIDMADHYAGFDRRITVYNFLRYSDRRWRLYNNDLQFQNRLRLSEFRSLHRRTGWQIVHEESRDQPVEVLRRVPLAERFRRYDENDLRVFESWIVSRPLGSQPAGG
ncbi:MAG TPA: class I SAM-dependent methyltransferase [Candidatus Polarisedimenticolaceae bacterium]|nr:class I SAM-dependent methyltransferase [Candidatus Polarisedimenticolaceae bacterium]